jgi:drug/metabolite transporter (DMT)-like permease
VPPLAVSLGYVLLIALWGSTWAAIKIGVDSVPPFVFAFERAVAVSVILVGLSLAMRHPFPRDRRVILFAAIVGIFNTGSTWAIIFWAEQYVPSGLVSVFGASTPIWTALLAHFLVRGDRLSTTKVLGLLLGIAGIGLLVGAPDMTGRPEVLIACCSR